MFKYIVVYIATIISGNVNDNMTLLNSKQVGTYIAIIIGRISKVCIPLLMFR
jgi:hypothetical protein